MSGNHTALGHEHSYISNSRKHNYYILCIHLGGNFCDLNSWHGVSVCICKLFWVGITLRWHRMESFGLLRCLFTAMTHGEHKLKYQMKV